MGKDINNPFNWRMRTAPSIFAEDPYFRPKGSEGKTGSQIMTEVLDKRRADGNGVDPGTIANMGRAKEKRLRANKPFGTYSRAVPSTKSRAAHERTGRDKDQHEG
ncbi:MAG: hypothetical protein ACRCTX_04710 [Afipia sp.]